MDGFPKPRIKYPRKIRRNYDDGCKRAEIFKFSAIYPLIPNEMMDKRMYAQSFEARILKTLECGRNALRWQLKMVSNNIIYVLLAGYPSGNI